MSGCRIPGTIFRVRYVSVPICSDRIGDYIEILTEIINLYHLLFTVVAGKKHTIILVVTQDSKPLSLAHFAFRYDVMIVIFDLIYVLVHCCTQ